MKLIPMQGDPKDRQSWNRGGRTHQLKKMIEDILRFADENDEYFLEITDWEKETNGMKVPSFANGLREVIKKFGYENITIFTSGGKVYVSIGD